MITTIDGKLIPETFNAKDFYKRLEDITELKLHKDFNCTIEFNYNGSVRKISVSSEKEISEFDIECAAGVRQEMVKEQRKVLTGKAKLKSKL